MTRNEAIAKIIDALDALQLLPPFPADEATAAPTTSQALLQNQSHELPTHHRVDPNTVSAPHPTTTTGQSAQTTATEWASQRTNAQNPDQSWQRLAAPDHPAGTA